MLSHLENAIKKHGSDAAHWCALRDGGENNLLYFLKKYQPIKHAVEIGTHHGITTGLIAKWANQVSTFDCQYYDILDVCKNVNYFTIDNDQKSKIINEIEFDFAFIDGDHRPAGVLYDWELVKKCGRVLFHDYFAKNERPEINGAKFVINELLKNNRWRIETRGIFAMITFNGDWGVV